jgi:EmrB/QacA subfamily drug resistance transporter
MTTRTRQWLVLAVVLMGTFMTILDVAIVNVAVPSIRDDLHASFGEVELVISAYTLTYACLLITGGRLGDLYGRRNLFVIGLLVFGVASALCGAAPNPWVLIGARAIQGVGGALMYPQVLAIIQVTFSGDDRGKALAVFGCVIGVAAIAGQIVGGALLALDLWNLAWRPIFLVNVPLALATIAAAAFVLPEEHRQENVSLDWGGVALIVPALLLLIIPLLEGRELGWPVWMIGCLIAAVPAFGLFLWYERQLGPRGGRPLMPTALFADRSFAVGIPIAGLFTTSYAGYLMILAVYLQVGLNFSPLHSGLIYTPSAVGFLITSLTAPRLVPLLGRHVLSVGYVTAAVGLLGTATTAYAAGTRLVGFELAPFLFVAGLGQGLGLTPLVGTVIANLRTQEAGAGAGVVTTTLQIGNALGIGLIGLIFFAVLGEAPRGAAYAETFAKVLPATAVLLLAAAWLVRRLPLTPFEAGNALLERLPGWSGIAYSMFLMTGGRVAGRLLEDVLSHVAERRTLRAQQAPAAPGEFLAFHFHAGEADTGWLHYLMREALAYGNRPVPYESDRLPVIRAQVDEVRRRQEEGLLPADMDPAQLRLFGFALVSYPRLLSQVTRMTTGMSPDDPKFAAAWEDLLRRVGGLLEAAARRYDGPTPAVTRKNATDT